MTAKDLRFEDEARLSLLRGVEEMAAAVAVTLGPSGRNALLEQAGGAPASTKDGVTVAREVELEDRFERLGAQMLRDVALVASNGDDELAGLVADAFEQVGRGYLSPHFITDTEANVCELEAPRILLHEGTIRALQPLLPILEAAARDGAPLLIVADDVVRSALRNGSAVASLLVTAEAVIAEHVETGEDAGSTPARASA